MTLVTQLIQIPFFLKYWGKESYGDWIVLTGLPMMLVLLDLGVAQASANRATVWAGANKWVEVRCSLQTSFAFTYLLGMLIVALSIFLNQYVAWSELLKLSTIAEADSGRVIFYMCIYLSLSLVGGPIDAWFRVIDKAPLGAFLISNRRLIDVGVSIILLIIGATMVQIAISLAITTLISTIALIFIAKHYSSLPLFGIKNASWNEFRSILKPSLAYASIPLSQTMTLQGSVQILNQLAGAPVVVSYVMARTLMRLIIQFGVVANNALKPEISRMAGQDKMKSAYEFTLKISKILIFLSICAYIAIVFCGSWIVQMWSGGVVNIDKYNLAAIGMHAVLNLSWFVPAALLIAINRNNSISVAYVLTSAGALILWIFYPAVFAPVIAASFLMAFPELVVTIIFWSKFKMSKKYKNSIFGS